MFAITVVFMLHAHQTIGKNHLEHELNCYLMISLPEHQHTLVNVTLDTLVMDLSVHWNETVPIFLNCVIKMLNVHQQLLDGNVFAIKVGQLINYLIIYIKIHRLKMEKLEKIHKINSKFTINQNIMKRSPPPVRHSGLSWPARMFLRSLKYQTKVAIAGGMVYYCALNGCWGKPKESYKFLNNLCATLGIFQ